MIITLLLAVTWWAIGQALLERWYKHHVPPGLAFPLGVAVSVLTSLLLWLGGVPIARGLPLTWFFGFLSVWQLRVGGRFRFPDVSGVGRRLLKLLRQRYSLPITLLGLVCAFSMAILLGWFLLVQPLSWDNLVLYDFRAQRMAEGWLAADFSRQFPGNPSFAMYDFLHPIFSSVLGAMIYSAGGQQVPLIYGLLLLSLFWQASRTFKHSLGRLVFGSLFLGSALFFQTATESYGVWLAVLYWGSILLFLLPSPRINRPNALLISLLLSAAMQSRLSEPYWLVFIIWLGWRWWLGWIIPLSSFVSWQSIVKQAARKSITGIERSTYALGQLLPQIRDRVLNVSYLPVLRVLLGPANPLWPFLGALALLIVVGWGQMSRSDRAQLLRWLILLFLWLGMLIGGTFALYLTYYGYWTEVSSAIVRGALPVALLCIVLCAWVADRLSIDADLVS